MRFAQFKSPVLAHSALIFLLTGCALAQQPVARITDLTGVVTKRHADTWLLVSHAPVDLFDGDKVNTDRGRASILFEGDNSTVVLDVGTNITIQQPQMPGSSAFLRRVQIYVGDVWFKMTKLATQHTALVTPTAVGGLRGTEGNVHVESESNSSFTLAEGELEITGREPDGSPTPNFQPVHIRAGETLNARHGQPFRPNKAATLPVQPDVKVPSEKLPEVPPGRAALLKGEHPGANVKPETGESPGEGSKGAKGATKAPAKKPPKTPPHRPKG